MYGRPITLTLALLLTSALAAAQGEPPRFRVEGAPDATERPEAWPEFEVVSVDPSQWMVLARDIQSGEEFRFRLPPQSFTGQVFSADLGAAAEGDRIDVQGQPDARLEQAVLQAPLGQGGGGGYGQSPGFGPMGGQPPPRTDFSPKNPYPRAGAGGPQRGGPMQYRIESFDSASWVVTARGADGSTVDLKIDAQAFVGYRFKAPVRNLRSGEGFALLALNQRPIEGCCTLVQGGRRR